MSTDPSLPFDNAGDGQDWSGSNLASSSHLAAASPAGMINDSPIDPSAVTSTNKNGGQQKSRSRVANVLTLTELRKAAWTRIYSSGLTTGDAAISTKRVPTWKDFDTLMIKRHRHIAVDPRDNRTLGWIACFEPFPLLSCFHADTAESPSENSADNREGRVAEIQIMVAEVERNRGVGKVLVEAILRSLEADRRYSTVQASFFPENEACRKLFERCGFQVAGTRSNVTKMLDGPRKGAWRDMTTVELKMPSSNTPTAHQQHKTERAIASPAAIDMTIDPNATLKRPRLD